MHKVFLALSILFVLFWGGCASKHRYIPKVKYPYPTPYYLKKTLRGVKGDRYVYAGQGPNQFDCSGLTYFSYATMNLWLPRRAIDQSKIGRTVPLNGLQYGDLIFFDTHGGNTVNHVAIYVGGGYFMHASSAKRRVVYSSINKPFYRDKIIVCKRLMKSGYPIRHSKNLNPPKSIVKEIAYQEKLQNTSISSGTTRVAWRKAQSNQDTFRTSNHLENIQTATCEPLEPQGANPSDYASDKPPTDASITELRSDENLF